MSISAACRSSSRPVFAVCADEIIGPARAEWRTGGKRCFSRVRIRAAPAGTSAKRVPGSLTGYIWRSQKIKGCRQVVTVEAQGVARSRRAALGRSGMLRGARSACKRHQRGKWRACLPSESVGSALTIGSEVRRPKVAEGRFSWGWGGLGHREEAQAHPGTCARPPGTSGAPNAAGRAPERSAGGRTEIPGVGKGF